MPSPPTSTGRARRGPCSLYPSAMFFMDGFLEGLPKVLNNLSYDLHLCLFAIFMSACSRLFAYVCYVRAGLIAGLVDLC